ncbi:MAG TPA: hypothetical protein VIM53_04405 [Candidatus Saccharimonadales bacterium]
MIHNIRRHFSAIVTSLVLLVVPMVVAPAMAYAATGIDIDNSLSCGSNVDVNNGSGNCGGTTAGGSHINTLITNIINVFSAIIGAIAVIMLIYGGLQFGIGGNDPGKVGNARNTITYALVGLVVVGVAQFLVQFVLSRVANTSGS